MGRVHRNTLNIKIHVGSVGGLATEFLNTCIISVIPDIPMKQLVQFAKALADPTRIRILSMLISGEICVCEIADAIQIPQSSLSTHLQTLRQCGVVRATKKGTWAYYALEEGMKPVIQDLEKHFGTLSEHTVQQDHERLQKRLAMRQGGCCVIGYGQIIRKGDLKL